MVKKTLSLFAAVALFSHAASATHVTVPLTELWVSDSTGTRYAWLRTSTSFTSNCGQSGGYMFIALNEENGREAYALALTAFIAGRNVTIGGAGLCDGINEKVRFLYMVQ
jgi:hypothetical protein